MNKILVVDDNECILDSMLCILQSQYDAHGCCNGVDAIAWARAQRPDLILLDVIMPEMDGYEVCKRLKDDEVTRDIPVIFVSSLDTQQEEHQGLTLGAIDYFTKPINAAIALVRIRNHLELRLRQNQLKELNETLELRVEQRTLELSRALEAARIADRAKDEFLANVSHELRTPLNAVIGMAELLQNIQTDARQRDYIDKIIAAGRTLSDIISDLLDLSKIAAGRMELEPTTFSLRRLLQRCHALMAHRIDEKKLSFRLSIDDAVPDVLYGASLRIEQILLNLLSNAVKFTAQGGVEVRVRATVGAARRLCLEIEVVDSGIGLRAKDMALLFKPFSQIDASMTRKHGGTGLGLAICKRLAAMMQGDIRVSSRKGEGTTFSVSLMLELGEADKLPAQEKDAGIGEAARPDVRYVDTQVLVVDDQAHNREIVETLLHRVGIETRSACDGYEAVELLRAQAAADVFDLVLMDVQMPVMDGLSATRAIRAMSEFRHLPIVAMTAHTMAHEKERGVAAGMSDHIGKPFDKASFYRVVSKWIVRSKQQSAGEPPPPENFAKTDESSTGFPALRGVDTQAGLALLVGDVARYRYWLKNFADEAPKNLADIRRHIAAGQAEQASLVVHTLKGRSGMLGMNGLRTTAMQLEAALDTGEAVTELLQALAEALDLVCSEIAIHL